MSRRYSTTILDRYLPTDAGTQALKELVLTSVNATLPIVVVRLSLTKQNMSLSQLYTQGTEPPEHAISAATIAKFASLPRFQATLQDDSFRSVSMSRTVTHSGRGHTLMGRTWNTPETIDALVSFYQPFRPAASQSAEAASASQAETRTEVRRFYAFGDALNAHPDLLHGGVISCILDSGLGGAVGMTAGRSPSAREGEGMLKPMFTVQLNVRFRAPVRAPGVVVVRAWVEKMEGGGRKVWARGSVEGVNGVVHAEAEGIWVRGKTAKI